MITFAISRVHWLLISISMSVLPVSSFLPPTWAMAERSWRWGVGIFGGLGLQPLNAPGAPNDSEIAVKRVGCEPSNRNSEPSASVRSRWGPSRGVYFAEISAFAT
jgi:hypothetical protein